MRLHGLLIGLVLLILPTAAAQTLEVLDVKAPDAMVPGQQADLRIDLRYQCANHIANDPNGYTLRLDKVKASEGLIVHGPAEQTFEIENCAMERHKDLTAELELVVLANATAQDFDLLLEYYVQPHGVATFNLVPPSNTAIIRDIVFNDAYEPPVEEPQPVAQVQQEAPGPATPLLATALLALAARRASAHRRQRP